ncbi:unnamed protein product [Rotaria sordida]|uniref:Protein kinase domain-containing protein n=1 Tax=Rotaria sordida TaxID=392033 RepID=A0A815LVL0_9BILA|nr:unnamed protein product [Rotaria sordida]CAF1415060.1 unnamed protein product [Rotaria sordida]
MILISGILHQFKLMSLIEIKLNRKEVERSRLSLIIHDVNMEIREKDIEKILKNKIGIPLPEIKFGKPYQLNGQKQKKVFLNFKEEKRINELMKNPIIKYNNQEYQISRHNPKEISLSGQMTCYLLIKISKIEDENGFRKILTEYDLNEYFRKFGKIISYQKENDNEIILQFEHYDIVDQIILSDISHTINGINIQIEKTRSIEKVNKDDIDQCPYCIHVTNMPSDITSEELSLLFDVHVADIILQPEYSLNEHLVKDDQLNSQAWIKNIGKEQTIRDLTIKKPQINLRGFQIHCNVINKPIYPFELCRNFELGKCEFSSQLCYYKHIICNQPNTCDNNQCHYGHSKKRQIISNKQNIEYCEKDLYRVRISNLPSNTSKEELQKRLNISEKQFSHLILSKDENQNASSSSSMVAYFICQRSEYYIRNKIREWHNSSYSKSISNKIKCQLEINVDFHDWKDKNQSSSSSIRMINDNNQLTIPKYAPWYRREKEFQIEQSNNNKDSKKKNLVKNYFEIPIDLSEVTSQWNWTNKILSDDPTGTGTIYSLVNKKNSDIKRVIKIYKNNNNKLLNQQCLQHLEIILDKIKNINGVPKFVKSNINNKSNDPWIIMENIEGITLHDFIKITRVDLQDALIITLKLLNIVKEIHHQNIVHYNINPHNIIIKFSSIKENNQREYSFDNADLILIDFDIAYCDDQKANEHKQHLNDFINCKNIQPNQIFYRVSQIERDNTDKNEQNNLSYIRTFDISHICAILFWLITKSYPGTSRDINEKQPHKLKDNIKIIEEELKKATGIWTGTAKCAPLERHLDLIFNCGFSDSKQQWNIEELEYQLLFMLQLTKKNNEEDKSYLTSSINNQTELLKYTSKNDSFPQLVFLIDWLKQEFEKHSENLHWSPNNKQSQWSGNNRYIENYDILHFQKEQFKISFEIKWNVTINNNNELHMIIKAKINQTIVIQLPLGIWQQYHKDNIKQDLLKNVQIEIDNLVDLLYYKEKNI